MGNQYTKKEININSENIRLLLDGLNVYKTSKSDYIYCQPEYRRKLIKNNDENNSKYKNHYHFNKTSPIGKNI
jgi:hypothetical protein